MKMFAGTQYYSMDCDSALGIYMHEANMEVHYGEGYAYCPILSWKMALVTSYNHQKELNLGASEINEICRPIELPFTTIEPSSILESTPFLRLKSSPSNYVEQYLVDHGQYVARSSNWFQGSS